MPCGTVYSNSKLCLSLWHLSSPVWEATDVVFRGFCPLAGSDRHLWVKRGVPGIADSAYCSNFTTNAQSADLKLEATRCDDVTPPTAKT